MAAIKKVKKAKQPVVVTRKAALMKRTAKLAVAATRMLKHLVVVTRKARPRAKMLKALAVKAPAVERKNK